MREQLINILLATVLSAIITYAFTVRGRVTRADLDDAYSEIEAHGKAIEKQIGEFERRVVAPLAVRVEKLETRAEHHVTREELHRAVDDLKEFIALGQERLKGDIKTLFNALRK